MFFNFLLDGENASVNGSAGGQGLYGMIFMVVIILIFYFFMIRPQSKKQKETQKMIDALKKGDKVVTIGGIHGVVSSTKEKSVIIKVDDGCKIEFSRNAIAGVEKETSAEDNKNAKKDEAEKNDAAESEKK